MRRMSTESTQIEPEETSTNLKRADTKELFPAPVLPTTPIFSHGLVSKVTPFSEGARCSLKNTFIPHNWMGIWRRRPYLYFRTTSLKKMTP